MAIPVATALARRDRLWPAVALSAAAHALLVFWALERRPPPIDLEQKPIVARLVRIGEKRPEQWLPRKEATPPPAPPAPAAVPIAAPPEKPAAPAPQAKPAPPRPPAPSSTGPAGGTSLASVLSKVQREVDETRYGDPGGDPAGDSDTSEGDAYIALVDRALRSHWVVPVTISERERLFLESRVVIWIEPDGRITRWRQERPSGNPTFDAAIERTLRVTPRVPPPPDRLRDPLRRTGIQLVFRARDS